MSLLPPNEWLTPDAQIRRYLQDVTELLRQLDVQFQHENTEAAYFTSCRIQDLMTLVTRGLQKESMNKFLTSQGQEGQGDQRMRRLRKGGGNGGPQTN